MAPSGCASTPSRAAHPNRWDQPFDSLIQEAGVEGQSVSVYGNEEELTRNVTEYLADVLSQIGLKPQLRIVNGDVYFQTIGNQNTKAAAGFANWFQDYPHPYNFMFLIDGKSIQNTNNQNFGNVDDEEINAMLAEANKKDISEAAAAGLYEAEAYGRKFPRIQILTVQGLMEGRERPEYINVDADLSHKRAKREITSHRGVVEMELDE